MLETVHKDGCWYPKAIAKEKRYAAAWPNFCQRCEGYGGFPWYDSDTGYQGYDPCPECLEKGRCSRCAGYVASKVYWDADLVTYCANCGFVEGKTEGHRYVEDACSCIEPHDEDYYIEQAIERENDGFAAERGDSLNADPYPYELFDRLYDEWRERRGK